jgi:hypothetical protein
MVEDHLVAVGEAIRTASDRPPKEAAGRIKDIWSGLDDLRDLAEARLRLVIGAVDAPQEGELPESWARELDQLEFGGTAMHKFLVSRAKRLMRTCTPMIGSRQVSPEFDVAGPTKIVVLWTGLPMYMQWYLEPCELPWPAVRVTSYRPDPLAPTALQKHRFYDAGSLVAHLSTVLP